MDARPSVRWIAIVAAFGVTATASAQGASTSEIAAAAAAGNRTLWVTNDGKDSGACGSRASPCRSISQAMENAVDGDTIWVGAGRYGHISGDPNFAGPGDDLTCHQKRGETADHQIERDRPFHQVVVMAAVAVADKVGIVLVHFDDPAIGILVTTADAFLNDPLAGLVLGNDVAQ